MKVQRRTPTGSAPAGVFWDGPGGAGGYEVRDFPTYAPCPEAVALRKLRHELELRLHEAAEALGCGVVEAGELERGVSEPAPPHTWDEAMDAYRAARGVR